MLTDKQKNIIVLVAALIIAGLFCYFGYKIYPELNPYPETRIDTILIHDTVEHHINHYLVKIDSVVYRDTLFRDVDTAEILKDNFALHYYTREWEDSLITATVRDTVTENKLGSLDFSYKILRPQQIINNVTNEYTYSKYFYVGINVPVKNIKYANFDLFYAFSGGYAGIGYNPCLNSISLKAGYRLKFLGRK